MDLTRRQLLLGATALGIGCRADEPGPSAPSASGAALPEVRAVTQIVLADPSRDGAGVRLSKSLGGPALRMLDPFLMLDEIRSPRAEDVIKGFPDHPHRGFETVTYVLAGEVEHKDSVGNRGVLGPGSAQWMTAGRGIVHSEMPRPTDGLTWALQLWVNLPKKHKLVAPRYQDTPPDRIPELSVAGSMVRLVTGTLAGQRGPIEGVATAPTMLDVSLTPGATFQHELPATQASFAYVLMGEVQFGRETTGPGAAPVPRGRAVVLGPGATVVARSSSAGASGRFLLFAGDPIGEPVARRGPFVMNTKEEIDQAYADWRAGTLASG